MPDDDFSDVIRFAVEKRHEAKRLEDMAKQLKEDADGILMPVLKSTGKTRAGVAGIGSVTLVQTTRKKFDQDRAKELLILKGIPAGLVASAFNEATSITETEYIMFTQEKVK